MTTRTLSISFLRRCVDIHAGWSQRRVARYERWFNRSNEAARTDSRGPRSAALAECTVLAALTALTALCGIDVCMQFVQCVWPLPRYTTKKARNEPQRSPCCCCRMPRLSGPALMLAALSRSLNKRS